MNRSRLAEFAVFVLLVSLGVATRVALQDIPNFAPVAGIALFAGYFFARPWMAMFVPLTVMVVSDRLVDAGAYDWRLMLTVYAFLTLPVLLGEPTRRLLSGDRYPRIMGGLGVLGCSLLGSCLFFFATNTIVWATSSWYPNTLTGLATCYANAVPFFRYTLAGDIVFTVLCFGTSLTWQLAVRPSPVRAAA